MAHPQVATNILNKQLWPADKGLMDWAGGQLLLTIKKKQTTQGLGLGWNLLNDLLDSSSSEQRPRTGSYEHGNEPSGSIKGKTFLNQLSGYWLFKKGSAPWS